MKARNYSRSQSLHGGDTSHLAPSFPPLKKLWDLDKFRAFPLQRSFGTWNNFEFSICKETFGPPPIQALGLAPSMALGLILKSYGLYIEEHISLGVVKKYEGIVKRYEGKMWNYEEL